MSARAPAQLHTPASYPSRLSQRLSRAAIALTVFLYLTAFPYHPELRSPNELCRLWQARSLVEFGELNINQSLATYGRVGDLSVKDGLYYPSKAPLLSFAAVPIYAVLRSIGGGGVHSVNELPLVFWSRFFLTVLPTLGLLILLRRFLRAYVSAPVATAALVTYALGSLGFSYSLLFMSHQTTSVLLFASFYLLWRGFRGERGDLSFVFAGALAGLALAAEYTAVIGIVGLVVYAVIESHARPFPATQPQSRHAAWRRSARLAGLATLGAAPVVGLLLAYHQAAFGHPLHSGYKYLADAAYQGWHEGGFLGIRFPDASAFYLSLFSPLRGFFSLSPFLIIGIGGLARLRNLGSSSADFLPGAQPGPQVPLPPDEEAPPNEVPPQQPGSAGLWPMTLVLICLYAYFTSSFSYDSWGWTTGPRHLTALVPFLVLPVALLLAQLRNDMLAPGAHLLLGICAGLCAASILISGLLSLVDYIPDDMSNALFGLVFPLFQAGFLPPSAFFLLGIPNPYSGLVLVAALLACAAIVPALLVLSPRIPSAAALARGSTPGPRPLRQRIVALTLAAAVIVSHLAIMRVSYRHSRQDQAALKFLRAVWLSPPGKIVTVMPSAPPSSEQ